MQKKKISMFVISIIVLISLAIFGYAYFSDSQENEPTTNSGSSNGSGVKRDPLQGLTVEQAAEQFNRTFVGYLLRNVGAQELHNPPLSSNTPKIQIEVSELIFNAEVKDGKISVKEGAIENEDIIIRTSRIEAAKMVQSKNYIKESFNSGKSGIELVAGKSELLAKGYMKIYNEFKS